MITCIEYDGVNGKLWYGTPQSTINCLELNQSNASPYLDISGKIFSSLNFLFKKGLPWISEYHILRSKRFVLTNSVTPSNEVNQQSDGNV